MPASSRRLAGRARTGARAPGRDADEHPDGRPDDAAGEHVAGVVVCHPDPGRADRRGGREQPQPQGRDQAAGRGRKCERVGGVR